jgi:hypothetical protein
MRIISGIPIVNGIADSQIHMMEKKIHEIGRTMSGEI